MQIYFVGPVTGDSYTEDSIRIINQIKDIGHTVWNDHPHDSHTHKFTTEKVRAADAVFANISNSDLSAGYLIAFAAARSIPVYIFYKQNMALPSFLVDVEDPYLHLVSYTDSELLNLVSVSLNKLMEDDKAQLVIPVSPLINKYLNWISNRYSVSKSTFVRSLIEAKMIKDKDYKKDFL